MYLRIELFGLFLELGALDAAGADDAAPLEAVSDGEAPGPIDAYDPEPVPDEHELPLGFHLRELALGDEDV